jgi:hypothetical protein
VTSEGSAHGWFQRAIEARNVIAAEAAARELGQLTLQDALLLVGLYADKDARRFERAAIRWHARLEQEARALRLAEAQVALAALAALVAPGCEEAARLLADLLRRHRLR